MIIFKKLRLFFKIVNKYIDKIENYPITFNDNFEEHPCKGQGLFYIRKYNHKKNISTIILEMQKNNFLFPNKNKTKSLLDYKWKH